MGELVNQLGNKAPGELIKSENWNGLVVAVENLSVSVNKRFEDVNKQLETLSATVEKRFQDLEATVEEKVEKLDTKIDALTQNFNNFRGTLEPLLGEYYRLTMETTSTSYAIGELAEITARVTDLRGNPLELSNLADRPWIDFVVASWGQLRPVAGFESLGGAGDRTISVRTDAQGVARVYVRSDHAENFTDEDEAEVAISLQTKLPTTNKSIAETILAAATPMEAKQWGAFQVLTAEYDRPDATRVSNYADAYFSTNATPIWGGFVPPIFTHRWRDNRSTVMAFARRDSDPVTPDQSRGVSSIQVTFRDWIGPWIITDYFVETETLVESFRERLVPKITDNFDGSVEDLKLEVNEFVSEKGLIGRQRNYLIMQEALDKVRPPELPAYGLEKLIKPMQDALGVQRMLESPQGGGLDGQEVAFGAFANAAAQAEGAVFRVDSQVAQVEEQITAHVTERLEEAREQLGFEVQQAQANLRDQLLAEDGPIKSVQKNLQSVTGQVQGFETALNAKVDMQAVARLLPVGITPGITPPSRIPEESDQ